MVAGMLVVHASASAACRQHSGVIVAYESPAPPPAGQIHGASSYIPVPDNTPSCGMYWYPQCAGQHAAAIYDAPCTPLQESPSDERRQGGGEMWVMMGLPYEGVGGIRLSDAIKSPFPAQGEGLG